MEQRSRTDYFLTLLRQGADCGLIKNTNPAISLCAVKLPEESIHNSLDDERFATDGLIAELKMIDARS